MVGTKETDARRHGEKIQSPWEISIAICALVSNYTVASSSRDASKKGGWSWPSYGFVKLNVGVRSRFAAR